MFSWFNNNYTPCYSNDYKTEVKLAGKKITFTCTRSDTRRKIIAQCTDSYIDGNRENYIQEYNIYS